jgi:hypothetical protein
MFKKTWHTKSYLAIIARAKERKPEGYVERHHVVPKCMGGNNDATNIVALTAREHFVCHLLLIRMSPNEYRAKLVYAAWQQSRPSKNKTVKVTNRTYALLREQMSISYTGQKRAPFSAEARKNISEGHKGEKNHMFGKTRTTEEKAKMSANRKGICTGTDNPFYGKQHTDEFKLRKAEHNRNRPKVLCPHCNKLFDVGMANRWHLDKCKSKP